MASHSGERRAEIISPAEAPLPILTPPPATSRQEDAVVVTKMDIDAVGDGRREQHSVVEGRERKDRELGQLSTDPRSLWDHSEKQLLLFSHCDSQQEIHFRTSLGVQGLELHTSTVGGTGLIPGQGTKIPQASWSGQKKKKKYILHHDPVPIFMQAYRKTVIKSQSSVYHATGEELQHMLVSQLTSGSQLAI